MKTDNSSDCIVEYKKKGKNNICPKIFIRTILLRYIYYLCSSTFILFPIILYCIVDQ